jgi:hypothetical protein
MKKWFQKIIDKKSGDDDRKTGKQEEHDISSLYEIVEDHLKSLDYDQLSNISANFAERFSEHQKNIARIVRTSPSNIRRFDEEMEGVEEFEVVDARAQSDAGSGHTDVVRASSDELVLSHYDRMIRSQYDRLIDLTVEFLKEVMASEVETLRGETNRIKGEVEQLREDAEEEVQIIRDELRLTEERHLSLIEALEEGLLRQDRMAKILKKRLVILTYCVAVAAAVGVAALILSLLT